MLDWLKSLWSNTVQWFSDLVVAMFTAIWDVIKDAASWVLEQFLDIAVQLLGSLDVSGLQGYTGYWSSLSSDIINVMGLLGFGTAAQIIMTAIGIRFMLQLIPFVRLGS